MKRHLGMFLAAAVCLLMAAPARAQGGFVHALGGVTFGTESAPVFGGGGGVNLGENVQLFGEFGRMGNVIPSELQDEVDALSELLSEDTGLPVTLEVRVPAIYGMGGLRYTVPTGGRVRPYIETAAGFARLSVDVNADVGGIDISGLVEEEAGIEAATKFLLVLGGGINIPVNDTLGIDVGYRWNGIFTDDPMIKAGEVYGGVRITF